jgi:hypothetical protein
MDKAGYVLRSVRARDTYMARFFLQMEPKRGMDGYRPGLDVGIQRQILRVRRDIARGICNLERRYVTDTHAVAHQNQV